MQVNAESAALEALGEGAVAGAPEYLVFALRQADAAMRTALTALRYARDEGAHPSGLPVQRLAGLASDMTGGDMRFLARALEVLEAMPATRLAFDRGQLSWSQLRGIVVAARPLRVADRAWLDDQLAGAITQAGEPDRVVQIAADLAGRCLDIAKPDGDVAALDRNRLVMQPTLDGRRVLGWFDLDSEGGATLAEATDAAADPPSAADQPVDADGRAMPKRWGPCRNRAAQRGEGLIRIAAHYLGSPTDQHGTPGQARPRCTVILPLAALTSRHTGHPRLDRPTTPLTLDRPDDPAVTARVLWRLAGGRARITRTSAARLACDATLIPLIVNGNHVPAAVGDAHSPITRTHRRAAAAADQGCRFPGCDAPAAWTDLHHVLWRE
ncbi:MAG TPA: hypothetical protein VMM13_19940, partial [Euzebya sp.]|nr:hypothetical protein [Euzebya sp.]